MERLSDKYLDYYDPKYFQVGAEAPLDTSIPVEQETIEEKLLREQHEGDSNPERMKGNSNAAQDYGYINKPGLMGAASMIPGPIGAVAKAANTMVNLNNTAAVSKARESMTLEPLSARQVLGSAIKDKHGQVADVNINKVPHSVGFEAISPSGATNLTPQEASKRAAAVGGMSEIAPRSKSEVLSSSQPERLSPSSPMEKLTGLHEGWLGDLAKNTVESIFGSEVTPDQAPTPTSRPDSSFNQISPTGSYNPDAPAPSSEPVGLMGTARDMKNVKPDNLGRVPIGQVNFDELGLDPNFAAKMKDFQKNAIDQGLDLKVDVRNVVRTPEQQAGIVAAGNSWTKNSYHLGGVGMAVDVSPSAVDSQGRITDQATLEKSRALASEMGFGLLKASKDPAHMQANAPGVSARTVANLPKDYFGHAKLSPAQALGVRGDSVPTPTSRPDPLTVSTPEEKTLMSRTLASKVPDQVVDQMQKNPMAAKSVLSGTLMSGANKPEAYQKTEEKSASKNMLEKEVDKSLDTKSKDSSSKDTDSKERSKSTTKTTKTADRKDSSR